MQYNVLIKRNICNRLTFKTSVSLIFMQKGEQMKEYLIGLGIGILLINIVYTNIVWWERNT